MSPDRWFAVAYLVGLVVAGFVRSTYTRKYQGDRAEILRQEPASIRLLMALWGVAQLAPAVYVFTSWLSFADFNLPLWASLIGLLVLLASTWLLWRSHADLAQNWSPGVEAPASESLVTGGVFRRIRHPMYSAHLLLGIAQVLLVHNWIAGFAGLVIFLPLYGLRVSREEKMMLDVFGQEYLEYMSHTGRLIPKFFGS